MIDYDYEQQEYYSSEEYGSDSDSEYYDYRDDPLYKMLYPEITNEELDYMHENYPGKYVGESFKKFPRIIEVRQKPMRITKETFKLEPIVNNFFTKKLEKKPEQKVTKLEEKDTQKIKEKKTWNVSNVSNISNNITTFQEKIANQEFPTLETMVSKIHSKNLKLEINKEEEWIDIKKKDKKKKVSSPSSSLCSFKTNTTSSSNNSFTKLCVYFINKKDCPHKNKCRYAHSEEQLLIKNCCFDKDCKFLKYKDNKYYNLSSEKICKYIHSFETKEEYFIRIKNVEVKNPTKDVKPELNKNIENTIETLDINKYNYTKKANIVVTPHIQIIEKEKEEKTETVVNEIKDDWIQVKIPKTKTEKSRDKAFDILSDKDKLKDKLKHTKLCLSVINKTICPHKNNCRYAHNIKELVVRDCLFQDECNFIKKEKVNNNYIYRNVSKTKICECKHKDESSNNYYERIGLSTIKKVNLK